ncbi:hypothetical protein WJX72_005441 [[Myrmecia] bisecta]|uniref:Preprotein translocase subunit SecE n=1 Tax=[Myrmecia] bisecta TaxID=41462 RepID=A0AAW1QQI6_9CHLO
MPRQHGRLVCRAKQDQKQKATESPVSVPGAAPAGPAERPRTISEPENEEQEASTAGDSSAAATEQPQTFSEDKIRELAALRQERNKAQNQGFIEGILEEVRLIEWPKPLQAVVDTAVVIAIVGGLSVVLFATNAALAELSKAIYK